MIIKLTGSVKRTNGDIKNLGQWEKKKSDHRNSALKVMIVFEIQKIWKKLQILEELIIFG